FQAEDGIRDFHVTGVQTCALPISCAAIPAIASGRDTRPIASSTGNEIIQRNGSTSATTLAGPGRTSIGATYPEKMNTAKYSRLRSEERRVGKEGRCRGSPQADRDE